MLKTYVLDITRWDQENWNQLDNTITKISFNTAESAGAFSITVKSASQIWFKGSYNRY